MQNKSLFLTKKIVAKELCKKKKQKKHHRHNTLPLNKPDACSCWTSPHGPGSGQRRESAHEWPLGSCVTAGGCCSDTKLSVKKNANLNTYNTVSPFFCYNLQNLFLTCEEAASKPPLTVPSQSSQEKCLSLNTLLRRNKMSNLLTLDTWHRDVTACVK